MRQPFRDRSNGDIGPDSADRYEDRRREALVASSVKPTVARATQVSHPSLDHTKAPSSRTSTDSTQLSTEELRASSYSTKPCEEKENLQISHLCIIPVQGDDTDDNLTCLGRPSPSTSPGSRHDREAPTPRSSVSSNTDSPNSEAAPGEPQSVVSPVACTLVAFERGALGLELEPIVDTRGRRLGCRVVGVTPGGQAARHGSVYPGDALVVLDGCVRGADRASARNLRRSDPCALLRFSFGGESVRDCPLATRSSWPRAPSS